MADLGKVSVTVEAEPYQLNQLYEKQTIVSHDDSIWISTQNVPAGQIPESGSVYWLLLASNKASRIGQDSTHRFVTDAEKEIWNSKASEEDTIINAGHGITVAQEENKSKTVGLSGASVVISKTAPTVQDGKPVVWVVEPS